MQQKHVFFDLILIWRDFSSKFFLISRFHVIIHMKKFIRTAFSMNALQQKALQRHLLQILVTRIAMIYRIHIAQQTVTQLA